MYDETKQIITEIIYVLRWRKKRSRSAVLYWRAIAAISCSELTSHVSGPDGSGLSTFASDNGDHESDRQGLQTRLGAERGGVGSPRNFHVNVPLKFNLLRHSNTRQVFASSHRAPWWPQLQPLPLALNTASSSAHVPPSGLNSNFFVVLCFSAINSLQGQSCFRVRTDELKCVAVLF